nr:hypothetical protein [Tanacetum cinerariifolium]
MSILKFAETHNLVAFLEKPTESEGFEQIIDFLITHLIKYALTVDGKRVVISEASIRSDLIFRDEGGIVCLPNEAIFEQLRLMGVTPLFPTMIVQAQQEVDDGTEIPTNTQKTLTIIQPTTSQPQRKQKTKKPRRKDIELPQTSVPIVVVKPGANRPWGMLLLRLGLRECLRVFALETTKTNQELEIGSLKRRVKKLEKKTSKRTAKIKILYKIGSPGRIESLDEASLGDQEDASKQGRIIDNLDTDERVTLVDETQGMNDQDMFDIGVLDDEEVVAEKEVTTADPVTTAGVKVSATVTTPTISIDDVKLAKALAALKSAKPMVKEPSVPKVKGIVMQEPKETAIITTTTVHSQCSKDKGKAKMIEPEKPLNKKF